MLRRGHTVQVRSRAALPVVVFALVVASCSGSDPITEPAQRSPTTDPVESAEVDPADAETAVTDPADQTTNADEPAPTADADSSSEEISLDIAIERNPLIELAASVNIATTDPTVAKVTATATTSNHIVEVPVTVDALNEYTIPLVGMRADSDYDVNVELFDEAGVSQGTRRGGTYTTGSVPEYFADHELTIDAERAAPGYTIVEFDSLQIPEGASSSQHLVAYDNEGEIVWYYTNTGALAGVEPTPAGTFNMFYWPFGIREVDILGNVVNNWRPQPRGVEVPEVDDEFVVGTPDPDQVAFQGGIDALVGNPGDAGPTPIVNDWIDLVTVHHENWPMPNGNILTLSTTVHELTPEQRSAFCPDDPNPFDAISDVAVEFTPDGEVVRTWDLWDAIDIDEHPGPELCVTAGIFAGEAARDWNHANSVVYDQDRDAVIISSRHTDQIVAFDHGDAEGPQTDVRWILGAGTTIADGGVNLPLDGEPTYFQHAVEVNEDGSLIVYDNGNSRPGTAPADPALPPSACTSLTNCSGAFSRAVIYDIDDSSDDRADWSATQRWEHIDTEDDGQLAYSSFISDADVLENGNVLVTHGGIGAFPPNPDDPLHILIREVVPGGSSGGDVVWELQSAPGFVTYRAERIPTFYFGPQFSGSV